MRDHAAYHQLRDTLKAELRARHIGAPDEYLSAKTEEIPTRMLGDTVTLRVGRSASRTKTPDELAHYENYIPIAVRRAALRANHEVRRLHKRRHRAADGEKWLRRDDRDIARDVDRLVQEYAIDPLQARSELAKALVWAEGIDFKSALARVRRAMRKHGERGKR